jgi:RNA polymerase sigma-70 factor (ECF subfamily)
MAMTMDVRIRDDESKRPLLDVATLYRRHLVMVRKRALRLLGDEATAQAVTNEAFIKLLEHRDFQGSPVELAAFLYRTVTNLALNRLREGLRQKELSALRSRRPTGEQVPAADDEMALLRDILPLVSYDEAQVAAYYYVDGLEPGEIAQLLGIEARTVGRRLACFDERAPRLLGLARARVRHVA